MFSAADILEALGLRRRLKSIRPETPGQLPPGWQSWLDGMSTTPRAIVGAAPQAVIAEFVLRELAQPPPRVANLNRWQAFATLWRQQWQAPAREERGLRWFAAIFSAVLHLVLGVLLLFLAFVHLPPPPGAPAGENVVQVEFIGEGTPENTGGGAPQGPAPVPSPAPATPAAPSAAQRPEPTPTPPVPEQPANPVAAQPQAQPEPVPPEAQPEPAPPIEIPPAPQPLQVTEVPQPDTTFVLPPPRPRDLVVPERQITVPEARQPTERISRVQAPARQVLEVDRTAPQVTRVAPTLRAEEQARLSATRALQPSTTTSRDISVPAVRAQIRDLPSRGTTPGAQPGASPSNASAPSGTTTAGTTAPGGQQPAPGSGTNPAAQPGAGTTPNAPPGAWPSPNRGDDWGVGTRNRPGGAPGTSGTKPGVFKADGTPNLGPATPSPGQNAPGTVEAQIADLDRAGQWLKRPPVDYTPTTFDKYWRPHETLLEEWVRRGIKTITIPIPGTGKRLQCSVSLLALGGACGLSDPNVNDQPASARPPPDIPFKPWLQEDNGSVRTPLPGARTTTTPASGASVARPPGS